MKDIRKKLRNIETAYIRLQQLETLLNLLANNYFYINNVNLDEKEKVKKLIYEYKTYQDVLFVGMDILHNQLNSFKENLYSVYSDLRIEPLISSVTKQC